MIIDKKYIKNLRETSFIDIYEEAEKLILERFSKKYEIDVEGRLRAYTEQAIHEQIRKMIRN